MIVVNNLSRVFVKYEKEPGLTGMIKGIFNAKKINHKVVNKISFKIDEGEIVGYIGANGAGKSTTIKMLTGILTPTSGEVLVNGINPNSSRKENAKNIGVVFGQRTQLWWDLPLGESYVVLKEIYQISDVNYYGQMEYFNELLGINEFIKTPVRALSLGQRMKADIVASLLHNPKVLYLDEPTIGLDAISKQNIRKAIKEINEKHKTTIILTTHDLDDIQELCSRVMILDKGKIIYDGSLETIKNNYDYMKVAEFEVENFGDLELFNINNEMNIEDTSKLSYIVKDSSLIITYNKEYIKIANISKIILEKFNVLDIKLHDSDIEDIISKIYQDGEISDKT